MKLKLLMMMCLPLACATIGYADNIGNANVAGPTEFVNSVTVDPFQAEAAWILGSPDVPRQFGYDPAAGYWLKNLNTVNPIGHNEEINLVEYFAITGTSLGNWSETSLTPGWVFSTDADDTWYSTDNGATKLGLGNFGAGNTSVQIPINPSLASGTTVLVHTELVWTGADQGFNGYVQVAQTVPEPCTFALLACGLAGLFVMRRRFAR